MKTIIRKKVGAFLLSLTFLIGLLPGGSVTAAAACAPDSHTPGTELHAADWNSQTGGYAYDYYLCTVCGYACDEDGYNAVLVGPDNGCSGGTGVGGKHHVIGDPYGTACAGTDTAQYYYCKACHHVVDADGTIVDLTALNGHTPGNTLYPADYAPCTGGCKTSYYRCTVCNLPCDANGDGSVYTPAGPMPHPHTPGSVLHPANWDSKNGGYIRSYYTCTVCDTPCDAKGHAALYVGPGNNCPMGHTPGSEKHEPDYTPCNGGMKEDWYECVNCHQPCDANGNTLKVLPPIGHTPGSEKHEPNYTPCGGGIKEEWYECVVCGAPCDAEGNPINGYPPTGKHTPGSEKHEPDYTPCGGGFKEEWYECVVCGAPCDADGNFINGYPPTGKHTPGSEKHGADYTPCNGGVKEDWYECETCHQPCDADGNSINGYPPTGKHTPGSEKHEPDYTPCNGGVKEDWYECDVCGAPCDANGNTLEVLPPIGHTPGSEKHKPDYTPCGGGVKEDWYECVNCHQPCDAEGNPIEGFPPTESHTLGSEKHEADYTPCGGGFKEDWYECVNCHQPCDAEGNSIEWFEPTGKHTPGSEKHDADYTPCNGGFKDDWYECVNCHQPCDADGNPIEGYEPTGSHTPGSEKHEPNYAPCTGGIKEDWYECENCDQPCDAEGNSIEIHEPTGSHHLVEVPAKDPTYEEDGNSAYWVCADCQALFKDAEGTTPIEDESEIVIPKLDKPNEKPDETPDETPEKPASGTLETVVSDGLAKVPSSVVSQYPTADNVYEAMIAAALKADPAMDTEKAGSVLLDVTLRIKNANGTITRVTARNFPSEGVEVLLPYPEGTDETFTFVVAHMITTGSRAGEIEILPNTSEKGGIRVRFMSLSPVTITYRASNTPAPGTEDASKPAPSDPADPDDSASIDKAPQTGVNNPLFWSFAALLCGGIVLACLAENKKRNR